MKNLTTIFYLSLFLSLFSMNLYADGTANDDCDGELISELNYQSITVNYTENGNINDDTGDEDDNYYFDVNTSGNLYVNYNSPDGRTEVYFGTSSCGNNNQILNNGNTISTNINVNAGDRVYITVRAENNAVSDYTINLIYTPDNSGGTIITPQTCPTGADEAFRDFCLRQKITVPGNMVTIGNTILVAPDTGDGTGTNQNVCSTYTNGAFISDATNANNSYYLCEYWDDPARPSTSATINNTHIPDPANSSVEWAGLYWQAIVPDTESVTNMTIKIKNGNDAYEDIGYDKLDWGDDVGYSGYISYSAFKDVTAILNSNNWIDGKYTVADIPVHEGNIPNLGSYGAWTLVIVYRNDSEKLRNFSIFDGWQRLQAGTTDEAIINISGFYTPKQTPISSSASVFTAEGDKHISGDYLYATNANSNDAYQVLSHTSGQTFNSAIVPDNFTRTPNPVNNQGIDIQTFQLGTDGENFLETTQSSIDFKFTTTQDTFFPSLITFNTELYSPELCYDYAYKQHGVYFTEDNNGSESPAIIGDVTTSYPITVELFIRNEEDSDTSATNMLVHITDINSSQATYVTNSAYVTYPGEVFPQAATPNPLQDIYIGTVGGKEYFHIDYDLDPVSSSIDMPIKAELEYTLVLSDSSGNPVPIDFKTVISENVPLCTDDNFAYYPDYSIFNVENSILSLTQKYNLPTQTANRAGDFKIVSYDKNNVDSRQGTIIPVGIEIIDASKYHDIKASCVEPDSALTPRVWVMFENNETTIDFDKYVIDQAIIAGRVEDQILKLDNPLTSAEDYYSFVKENAAFRVVYNGTDTGDDIVFVKDDCQAQQIAPCYRVTGFSNLPQYDAGNGPGNCTQNMDDNENSVDRIPDYCGNAGSKGLDSVHLAECMECIYGGNTRFVCSRDNFAIRPESFRIALSDQEQLNGGVNKSFIANNDTPSKSHSSDNGDRIVAGYNYYVELNATNHQNDNATPGYYVSFTEDGDAGDRVFSLKWWDFTGDDTYCNDTSDHNKSVTFFNGTADMNLTNNEIGKYDLNLIDRIWTRVDWDSAYRGHQSNTTYFEQYSDCRKNVSVVPVQSSSTATYLADMSGCDINTTNHTNSEDDINLEYTDMPLHIFPYTFNHVGVNPSIGPDTRDSGQEFVYIDTPPTSDANNTNMSYNMSGTFFVTGRLDDTIRLSNFVTGCYADDVDMDLLFTYNIPEPTITPYLSYSLKDINATAEKIRPLASDPDDFEVDHHDSSTTPFIIMQDEAFFAKDMNGSINMDLGYNFVRAYNQPLNPRYITFHDFNLTYTTNPTGIKADLESDFQIFGNKDLDDNVTFVYGRAKPSQYFYDDVTENSINTPISVVVYCDEDPVTCSVIYNINTSLSTTDEYEWFLSHGHVTSDNDGNITLVVDGASGSGYGSVNPNDPTAVNIENSGGVDTNVTVSATTGATRPQDVYIDFGSNTNRFLIYNKYTNTIPSPFYRVRFIGQSDWAGHGDTGYVVDSNVSTKKNRRLGW